MYINKQCDEMLEQKKKSTATKQLIPKGRKNAVTGMIKIYWDEVTTLFTFCLKGS